MTQKVKPKQEAPETLGEISAVSESLLVANGSSQIVALPDAEGLVVEATDEAVTEALLILMKEHKNTLDLLAADKRRQAMIEDEK